MMPCPVCGALLLQSVLHSALYFSHSMTAWGLVRSLLRKLVQRQNPCRMSPLELQVPGGLDVACHENMEQMLCPSCLPCYVLEGSA